MDLNTVKAKFLEGLQREVEKKRVQEGIGGTLKRGMVHMRRASRAVAAGAKKQASDFSKGAAKVRSYHAASHDVSMPAYGHAGRMTTALAGAAATGTAAGLTANKMIRHASRAGGHAVSAAKSLAHGKVKDAAKSAAKAVGHHIAAHPIASAGHAAYSLYKHLKNAGEEDV